MELPIAWYGDNLEAANKDKTAKLNDYDDDEELKETPASVIAMLGLDPLDA